MGQTLITDNNYPMSIQKEFTEFMDRFKAEKLRDLKLTGPDPNQAAHRLQCIRNDRLYRLDQNYFWFIHRIKYMDAAFLDTFSIPDHNDQILKRIGCSVTHCVTPRLTFCCNKRASCSRYQRSLRILNLQSISCKINDDNRNLLPFFIKFCKTIFTWYHNIRIMSASSRPVNGWRVGWGGEGPPC